MMEEEEEAVAPSYERIAEVNNLAVGLIQTDLQQSLILFRTALETTKELLLGLPIHEESVPAEASSSASDQSQPLLELYDNRFVALETAITVESAFFQVVELKPLITVRQPHEELTALSVAFIIIVFNYAVAHHVGGFPKETHVVAEKLLEAQSLYANGQNFLRQFQESEAVFTQVGGRGLIQLVNMASYNNLAHIDYTLGDYAAFVDHLYELAVQASNLDPWSYEDSETALFLEWHKRVMINNVLMMQSPTIAAAA